MAANLDPFLNPMVTQLREHLLSIEEDIVTEQSRLTDEGYRASQPDRDDISYAPSASESDTASYVLKSMYMKILMPLQFSATLYMLFFLFFFFFFNDLVYN
jgi:hypothetical protein